MRSWHESAFRPMKRTLPWCHNGREGVSNTSLAIVYSTVYSIADARKHQSLASLDFVREIHRWAVNSPHKGPVTRKMFSVDDVIMIHRSPACYRHKGYAMRNSDVLLLALANYWASSQVVGYLQRHNTHVMSLQWIGAATSPKVTIGIKQNINHLKLNAWKMPWSVWY